MTLYGIISDIHANEVALIAVLERMKEMGIIHDPISDSQQKDVTRVLEPSTVFCLGDIVGYGPRPVECLELLGRYNIPSVRGNHEDYVSLELGGILNPDTAKSMKYAVRKLKRKRPDLLKILHRLPLAGREGPILFCHGNPGDESPHENYIKGIYHAAKCFHYMAQKDANVCFVGHFHTWGSWEIANWNDWKTTGGDVTANVTTLDSHEFVLDSDNAYVIRIGSIGQPRDGDPRASFTTFDTETRLVQEHRVEYDVKKTQGQMKWARLPRRFRNRLALGV